MPFIVADAELYVCIQMGHVLCDRFDVAAVFALPNSGLIDIFRPFTIIIPMPLWESDPIFAVCEERIKRPLDYVPNFLQALSARKM